MAYTEKITTKIVTVVTTWVSWLGPPFLEGYPHVR